MVYAQQCCQPLKRAGQIAPHVRIVKERHVGPICQRFGRLIMADDMRQRCGIAIKALWPAVQKPAEGDAILILFGEPMVKPMHRDVANVLSEREMRVEGMAEHADILRLVMQRQAVHGRVAFHAAPGSHRLQPFCNLCYFAHADIDPWHFGGQLGLHLWVAAEQKGNHSLHPGGATLGRGDDKDIIGPHSDVIPAAVVGERSKVELAICHESRLLLLDWPRSGQQNGCPMSKRTDLDGV